MTFLRNVRLYAPLERKIYSIDFHPIEKQNQTRTRPVRIHPNSSIPRSGLLVRPRAEHLQNESEAEVEYSHAFCFHFNTTKHFRNRLPILPILHEEVLAPFTSTVNLVRHACKNAP